MTTITPNPPRIPLPHPPRGIYWGGRKMDAPQSAAPTRNMSTSIINSSPRSGRATRDGRIVLFDVIDFLLAVIGDQLHLCSLVQRWLIGMHATGDVKQVVILIAHRSHAELLIDGTD